MKVLYTLLLVMMAGISAHAQSSSNDSLHNSITADKDADFDGGTKAWTLYLMKNLTYPEDAQRKNITGTVIVQFQVDEKGKVSEVMALSGPEQLKKEGIRLIKHSPRWIPAMKNGEKVRSFKTQQISFRLS